MHGGKYIKRFDFWDPATWSIPKLYWDAFSQEQRIHAICRQLGKVIAYADYVGANTDELKEQYTVLKDLFDEFQESGFEDYYEQQIEAWVNANLDSIFQTYAKQVYFGINEQGYFVAYIPDSWDDIVFDTGMQYGIDTYGRLILRWDVDDSNETVNQRPEDWS